MAIILLTQLYTLASKECLFKHFQTGHTTDGIVHVYRRFVERLIPVITDTLLPVNLRNCSFPCFTCQYTPKF